MNISIAILHKGPRYTTGVKHEHAFLQGNYGHCSPLLSGGPQHLKMPPLPVFLSVFGFHRAAYASSDGACIHKSLQTQPCTPAELGSVRCHLNTQSTPSQRHGSVRLDCRVVYRSESESNGQDSDRTLNASR